MYKPLVRPILKYPEKSLLKPSEVMEKFNNELVYLVADMFKTIQAIDWGNPVGLAAPQIGVNKQVFIAQGKVYVNPHILNTANSVSFENEGCYSLEKNKDYMVKRPQTVWVSYQDINGKKYEEKLNGFKARVFCHEYDHLKGKLCSSGN